MFNRSKYEIQDTDINFQINKSCHASLKTKPRQQVLLKRIGNKIADSNQKRRNQMQKTLIAEKYKFKTAKILGLDKEL